MNARESAHTRDDDRTLDMGSLTHIERHGVDVC